MEQKYLMKVLENEARLNKIVEVLALSPAKHFNVSYLSIGIEIDAYTRSSDEASRTERLLQCFMIESEDIEISEYENEKGKFWVTKLYIGI